MPARVLHGKLVILGMRLSRGAGRDHEISSHLNRYHLSLDSVSLEVSLISQLSPVYHNLKHNFRVKGILEVLSFIKE